MRNKILEREYFNIVFTDRSAMECAELTMERMKGFAEWKHENRFFWFNKETQKWYYTFPNGTAIPEPITKTTDELIQMFLNSLLK